MTQGGGSVSLLIEQVGYFRSFRRIALLRYASAARRRRRRRRQRHRHRHRTHRARLQQQHSMVNGLNLPIGAAGTRAQGYPVAILWDIENCPVPNEVSPDNVAGNVRMALNMHPAIRGAVTMFSAYGDFNHFPRKLREGCQRTGVNLIDVPNTKKDASDKAILVDMFLFALDNPPPCTILLISGDVDFAPALHKLGQRGYTVVLAIPSGYVSSSLSSAGRYVWDWGSLARGQGLVTLQPRESLDASYRVPSDESGDESLRAVVSGGAPVTTEWSFSPPLTHGLVHQAVSQQMRSQQVLQPEAERRAVLVSQAIRQPQQQQHVRVMVSSSSSRGLVVEMPSSTSVSDLEVGAAAAAATTADDELHSPTSFVQPGDLTGLKRQLVRLISMQGGTMKLVQLPPEYSRRFGRPLYLADYNTQKLVHLLDKLQDVVSVKGDPKDRMVHLTEAGVQLASKYNWASSSNVGSTSTRPAKSSGSAAKKQQQQQQEQIRQQQIQAQSQTIRQEQQQLAQELKDVADEEPKDVVDEEVVLFTSSRLDLSDSTDEQAEEDLEEVEVEIQEVVSVETTVVAGEAAEEKEMERRQESFRRELQELLVSYACHIVVSDVERLYRQRYSKELDYAAFGVEDGELEALLDKVKDVGIVREVQGGSRTLVANLGILPQHGSLSRTSSELILL